MTNLEYCKRLNFVGEDLDDLEKWNRAVSAVNREFALLPESLLAKLKNSLKTIKEYKRSVFRLTETVNAGQICEACQGACCRKGKYHFTVIDLLVYLVEGKELFVPCFNNGRCPYSGDAGCLMEVEYRPFNCITFQCEKLERLLLPADIDKFYMLEKELRSEYADLERIFDNRFAYGLLANYERNFIERGTILFKDVPGG
jgi:hypothetical protein